MQKRCLFVLALITTVAWQACEYEVVPRPVDCEENPVTINVVSTSNANCGQTDGSVEVVAAGGNGEYMYFTGNGQRQESPVFENLAAGLYDITAVDDNDCSAALQATVLNANGVNISVTTTDAGGCSSSQGTLTVNAFDGTQPYQYKLDEAGFSPNPTFTALSPGEYSLLVSDASGCEVTQNVRILSGISYSASIAPIIENDCAISGCHNGSQFPDFRVFKNIHDNAGQIKALTQNRTMPQDRALTQAEIDMIACWVDDGAPEN